MTYEVLKHPEVLLKLRTEIDEVLGERPVTLEDLSKMPYTLAVLRETLRFRPPASTRSVFPAEATTIGNGKYAVTPGDIITVNVTQVHRDPEIWGDDVRYSRSFLFAWLPTPVSGTSLQTRANVGREVRGIASGLLPVHISRDLTPSH